MVDYIIIVAIVILSTLAVITRSIICSLSFINNRI
jgi:hypothetical protein